MNMTNNVCLNHVNNWKHSISYNTKMMLKFKNQRDASLHAFKNSLMIFAQGHVSDDARAELADILSQVKTTQELVDLAQKEAATNPTYQDQSWQQVPCYASCDHQQNVHVLLKHEKCADCMTSLPLNHPEEAHQLAPNELPWQTVDDEVEAWLAKN